MVSFYYEGTSDLSKYIQQSTDGVEIWCGPLHPHPDAQNPPNASYIIAGGRGEWRHNSLLSNYTHHHRVCGGTFWALIFWHYLGHGVINNASHTKITHTTINRTPTASVHIMGAWGMLWLGRKWGETANFIFHFFILFHTKTSFVAYFQCLDKSKQCKWLLWMLVEVVSLRNEQWNGLL